MTDNAALFFPTSTATTLAATTGAPLKDITHLRRASAGPASQRHILEGTRWIPSDTSGGVWKEGTRFRSYQSGQLSPCAHAPSKSAPAPGPQAGPLVSGPSTGAPSSSFPIQCAVASAELTVWNQFVPRR